MKWLLAVLITMLASPAAFAEPDEVARTEVAHLLKYLETSGCQFQRNGSWYASARAASHLNQKYEYLLKKDLVTTAGQWLSAELQRFRTKNEN